MHKFYIDNYNQISSDTYDGKATLCDGINKTGLLFFHGGCTLPFDVELKKHYFVEANGSTYPVEYRFIVHSERFEKEYAYDGKLGSFYYGEYSEFYVWAPTAYSMSVVLIDDTTYPMEYQDSGVYYCRIDKDLEGIGYLYEVEHLSRQRTLDPYAKSSYINSQYNFVVNPSKIHSINNSTPLVCKKDAIVYETHVRDLTSDPKVPFSNPGKFVGFTEKGVTDSQGNKVGYDYILDLGVNHIQLLPIYDFGSIDESDSSHAYNWGYDPVQYNVIEGKYSCNPKDPYCRINEVIDLVNQCRKDGIGVIMDVVYNHVYNKKAFSYEKLVPHYFFRYQGNDVSDASFCGNETASERYMVRRFMKDSIIYLTKTFGFHGYRFDLMGIHDIETMNQIHDELMKIDPTIIVYGEGWTMPTAIQHNTCAIQKNHQQTPNIGYFNDDFRNVLKQVIIGYTNTNTKEVVERLLKASDYVTPMQSVNYISCHDDYTLFDQLHHDFEEKNVINKMKLAYTFIILGQGFTFMHAGCEGARTKYGIKNSFNSSMEINLLRYDELYHHHELIEFVKELIRIKNTYSKYFYATHHDIEKNITITVKDNIVEYKNLDLHISINLDTEKKGVTNKENIISIDGTQEIKEQYEIYMIVKGNK